MLPLIEWTTVRLVVFQKNDGRRHDSEMEPQGRTIASPFHTRRRSNTFHPSKTTLRIRVHVQAVGLNAKTKNRSALSRRGTFSLDIPFYRTSAKRNKRNKSEALQPSVAQFTAMRSDLEAESYSKPGAHLQRKGLFLGAVLPSAPPARGHTDRAISGFHLGL